MVGREGDAEAGGVLGDGGRADGLHEQAAVAEAAAGVQGGAVGAEDDRDDGRERLGAAAGWAAERGVKLGEVGE